MLKTLSSGVLLSAIVVCGVVFAAPPPTLPPVETPVELSNRLREAVQKSNAKEVAELADRLRAQHKLWEALRSTADEVIKEYRPEVMDVFLANGYANGQPNEELARLAGQCGRDKRWIAYFKAHGAFEKNLAVYAYCEAIASGEVANAAGLIEAKVDFNQIDQNRMTALHHAIWCRNPEMVQLLVQAGARSGVRDQYGKTAIEYAVQSRFVPAIRLLDSENKFTAVLEQFSKDFPPAPSDSPYLGVWICRIGADTFKFSFSNNGTGISTSSIGARSIAWRIKAPNKIEAFLLSPRGETETERGAIPMSFDYTPEKNTLVLKNLDGSKMHYVRKS